MQPDTFKYIEKCLYDYPSNLIKLTGLVEELNSLRESGDVNGQSYNNSGSSAGNSYANPVASFFEKLEQAEHRIKKLAQRLGKITVLYDALKSPSALDAVTYGDYRLLLELFYFGALPRDDFMQNSGWSRGKFYARRKGLIHLAQEFLHTKK